MGEERMIFINVYAREWEGGGFFANVYESRDEAVAARRSDNAAGDKMFRGMVLGFLPAPPQEGSAE